MSSHVILVVEENTSYNTAVANMPWLVQEGNLYGHATNYTADTSGSLLAYLWLSSGSCHSSSSCGPLPNPTNPTNDYLCGGGGCTKTILDNNIFRILDAAGKSWKVYLQSLPSAGWTSGDADPYVQKHNPALWYSDIISGSQAEKNKMVPFTQFATDLANNALPAYSIIVPDLRHDAHDCPAGGQNCTPLTLKQQAADNFLSSSVAPVLNQSYFQPGGDGLLIITFDNGDGDNAGLVYTAVIGPKVTPHSLSNVPYKHENNLRTILQALGMSTFPGRSNFVNPMSDFFGGGSSGVTVNSPSNGSIVPSSVLVDAFATESGATIDHLEVWDNGVKLGNSPPGSTIHQTFTLSVGAHQMTVQDMSTGTFQILHKTIVNFTVSTDGVTINSPTDGAATGTSVLVDASASESAATIDHLEVWDNGIKLGNSPPGSTIHQTFVLTSGSHQMTVQDMSTGTFQVLHKSVVTFTVAADGVTITSPVTGSTSGTQVLVSATASESAATIDHLEVWDNTTGQKLGDSPKGSTVNQSYNLAVGQHQIIVQDMSTGTFQVIHKSNVTITVASASGITILAPTANSSPASPVLVSAYANSTTAIDHLEIWDNTTGTKLGNSPGTEVDTSFVLGSGTHTLIVQSMSAGTFQILNTSQVTITVP
ncbi:MAG TPA: alkaline phosphatase family protein [Candidatus Angelobacter sp.]